MSAELLSSIVASILSLVFAYVPGIEAWFTALDAKVKASVMAIVLILTTVAIFALTCAGLAPQLGVICDKNGALALVQILIAALMANQSTYVLLVKPFKPA